MNSRVSAFAPSVFTQDTCMPLTHCWFPSRPSSALVVCWVEALTEHFVTCTEVFRVCQKDGPVGGLKALLLQPSPRGSPSRPLLPLLLPFGCYRPHWSRESSGVTGLVLPLAWC